MTALVHACHRRASRFVQQPSRTGGPPYQKPLGISPLAQALRESLWGRHSATPAAADAVIVAFATERFTFDPKCARTAIMQSAVARLVECTGCWAEYADAPW